MNKLVISIILSVLITAIVTGGGVYFWQKSAFDKEKQQLQRQIDGLDNQIDNLSNQMSTMKEQEKNTQSFKENEIVNNVFDIYTAKPKDKIGEMTLESITPFPFISSEITDRAYIANFSGQVMLEGEFDLHLEDDTGNPFVNGLNFSVVESKELAKLPIPIQAIESHIGEYNRELFWFNNWNDANNRFGFQEICKSEYPCTLKGRATIIIDDYIFRHCECDNGINLANLVEIIELEYYPK